MQFTVCGAAILPKPRAELLMIAGVFDIMSSAPHQLFYTPVILSDNLMNDATHVCSTIY
jgi:hypothetical protein